MIEGVTIPLVGFGTNGIQNQETIQTAIQQGCRLFDSADLYQNADELAKAVKESTIPREEFFINYKIKPNLGKKEFLHSVEEAISKFEYIDCLMLHDTTPSGTDDLEEILESLRPYIKSGKIRHIGVSNVSVEILERFLEKFPEITLVQNKFSYLQKDEGIRALCKEKKIHYMGYGLFGGREEGACTYNFDIHEAAWNLSESTFPELHSLAKKYHTTPHEMLLAWAILEGTIQIPSSIKKENMTKNLAAQEIAKQISIEDQHKLSVSLHIQVPDEQWNEIKQLARQGDRLALLKLSVGNSLPRHRLLEKMYHEDNLKFIYDLLLDQNMPTNMLQLVWKQINALTHFLEENLKLGEAQFQEVVKHLKIIAEAEKDGVFELIDKFGNQRPLDNRIEYVDRYIKELSYLKENGCFDIKEIDLRQNKFSITIGIVGPDHKIYIVRNIANKTSLKELSELLAKEFPEDFKDNNLLESFYISHLSKENIKSSDITFRDLDFSDPQIIGVGKQKESDHFSAFFHYMITTPEAFTQNRLHKTPNSNAKSISITQSPETYIELVENRGVRPKKQNSEQSISIEIQGKSQNCFSKTNVDNTLNFLRQFKEFLPWRPPVSSTNPAGKFLIFNNSDSGGKAFDFYPDKVVMSSGENDQNAYRVSIQLICMLHPNEVLVFKQVSSEPEKNKIESCIQELNESRDEEHKIKYLFSEISQDNKKDESVESEIAENSQKRMQI